MRSSIIAASILLGAAGCGTAGHDAPEGGAGHDVPEGSAGGENTLPAAGGAAGSSNAGGSGGNSIACNPESDSPPDAPALSTTLWTDISPEGFPFNSSTSATGLAVSPCNPSVLYLCTGSFDPAVGGLYRSENAGTSWAKVGRVPTTLSGGDHLEGPNHVRIDPFDPQHLYAVEGVRGDTEGFWVSTDGGDSFTMPGGFRELPDTADGIFPYDIYDIAVDPMDFGHILLSHHFGWGAKWGGDSGVLESTDGGTSWSLHEPEVGWGTGHAINFLFDPELGIGNRDTWLLGTQGDGMWRTTDAGKTWTQVTTNGLQHGGGTIYYDKTGVLYASGTPNNLRSTDNGEHWTEVCAPSGYTAIFGDGTQLYTRSVFNTGPFLISPEGGDGATWTDFSGQVFNDGPFEMTLDRTRGILYSSSWGSGLLALKLP
jgi:hypothetical protein